MRLQSFLALLFAFALMLVCPIHSAQAQDARALVSQLALGSFKEREAVIMALAATGDPAVIPVLEALSAGNLYVRKADTTVFIGKSTGDTLLLVEPLTLAESGEAPKAELDKIKVNNGLRRVIANAASGLALFNPDLQVRRQAVLVILKSGDPSALAALLQTIERESDPALKSLMQDASAAATLRTGATEDEKLAAIARLSKRTDRDTANLLATFAGTAEDRLKTAALEAAAAIEKGLAVYSMVQNLWYGLSLGSVLLLAAVGLAVTFGVMGVINMAHGEMVMLGAYTTFVIQNICRTAFPGLVDYSLILAIPLAFAVAGGVGILIERGVIRFLYGRPLETLLATWGISLILQQTVRSIFGATNKEVSTPSWMSGSIELVDGLSLTMNRLMILLFALAVFAGLMLLLRKSAIGLQMRAVTQNRPMANAMGIRSGKVDALTFGLGSGIAGLAGVALTQIDNVSPNLGQGYIIDSFLVVVFGGVGNLWGTLAGAMALGIANKFLEPVAGAVLGKIFILVAVILFIQKRPRGLFALKGRWVDA